MLGTTAMQAARRTAPADGLPFCVRSADTYKNPFINYFNLLSGLTFCCFGYKIMASKKKRLPAAA